MNYAKIDNLVISDRDAKNDDLIFDVVTKASLLAICIRSESSLRGTDDVTIFRGVNQAKRTAETALLRAVDRLAHFEAKNP